MTYDMAVRVAAQFEELKDEMFRRASAEPDKGLQCGLCAQACKEVEQSIFEALNCLSSYLDDPAARELLREGNGWQDAKRVSKQVVA